MQQRREFIDAYLAEQDSIAELCRRFGISRKTGYKWIGRFMAGCELIDRSRRPHRSPRAVSAWLEDAIVTARKQRPRWGPKKLRAVLLKANPGSQLPSLGTFALIFKRNGLVTPRRKRRRTPPSSAPLSHALGPNAIWCMDFKGDFLVQKTRCYPLTVMDAYSRYLLACVALRSTEAGPVLRALRVLFDTFGLPEAIRTDNGCPFASNGVAGLSELSVWWSRLGIRHERIEPGKPQQNGRHERMHLTLKLETTQPTASSLRSQQRLFDRFRREYNELRPHEALHNDVPSDFYQRSARLLPHHPDGPDFAYPDHFETVRVRRNGAIRWGERMVRISTVLKHQLIGLHSNKLRRWDVYLGARRLGELVTSGRKTHFVARPDGHPSPPGGLPDHILQSAPSVASPP